MAYSAAAFIVVLSGLAFLTQTQFFRDRLRSFALDQLDTLLIAEVHLGEIHGNLVTGFSIDSVSIKVRDEYFVRADRIDIRYDLFQIPSKKISVSLLTLIRPQIAMVRGRDSLWNFQRMIVRPDDTTKTPFDWPIAVQRFEIQNGTFRLVDSMRISQPDHRNPDPYFVEYHDFAVRDLDMRMTSVLVSPDEKRATIDSLTFVSDSPDVRLRNLSARVSVTRKEAVVKNLFLQTSRSTLRLNASMKDVDLFRPLILGDLKSKPVDLELQTNDLDLNELKRFIQQIELDGKVTAELIADGEFGNINVRQLDVKTRSSEVHIVGSVSHLDQPSTLFISAKCRETKIPYADVMAFLPNIDLPDYTSLGTVHVDFDFEGEPRNFRADLSVRTNAGSISTKGATLKIGGPESIRYHGEFQTRGVDLSSILHDKQWQSSLNSFVKINGSGTSLDNLNATVDASFEPSTFAGNNMGASHIVVTSAQKKILGNVQLVVGSMHADLKTELDRSNKDLPTFKVDGRVSSLNLADFLSDKSRNSDLTFDVKADGSGLRLDKLSCIAMLDFSSSRYKQYQIDSSLVNLTIDQRDPLHSRLTVNSSLADFSITGQFDLDYMVDLVRYEVESMNLAIGQRFKSLDSTLATTLDVKKLEARGNQLAMQHKKLNTEYELTFKNLQPLSLLAGDRTFDAIGTIKGNLNGNYESLDGGALMRLQEFFYGNADSGMLIQDGIITLKFSDLKPTTPLADLTLRVKVDAGKMHVNRTKLDTLNFGIFYEKEYAGFSVQADYDKDFHLRTNGQIGVTDNGVLFTMSRLETTYKDFVWNADDGAILSVNQNGMRVQNLVLRRDSQSVTVNGAMLKGGMIDANITGNTLQLENLRYVLTQEERQPNQRGFEGLADFEAHASGTLEAPLYHAKLRARNVFFRGFPFGIIQGDLNYKDKLLSATLLIDNRATSKAEKPDLTVQGTLPIDLGLKNVEQRLTDKPMDFTVYSDGLQMSLLDPLLATFNELSGTLKTNLKVSGTPKHPEYSGTISVENCAFLFVPNNMHYEEMKAQLEAEGERIKVISATVKNTLADSRPGRMGALNISGDFLLQDLVPSDFNFLINGQLVVVNENTRTSDLSVYGDLFMEILPPGLRYTGNIERSLLKGPVLVRNSSLIFPPTSATLRSQEEFSVPVTIVNDTLKVVEDSTKPVLSRYFTTAETGERKVIKEEEKRGRSFIDGLRYDLDIESAGGNTEIRMIFNAATGEELIANIDGKFTITEDGKTWVGDLNVTRASYNFYGKRFDAEGSMTYTGDFLNPELNITARYQGTRQLSDKDPEERILVILKITGTRFAPKADMAMKINDIDYDSYSGTKSGDVQSDALMFVITGTFPISRSDANDLAGGLSSTVQSTVVGGATSLLTSTFSEFLRSKTGFINSIELGYETGPTNNVKTFGQRADIRLSGTAFKGYWRYGGKILEDPFSNANFSILYSFGDIFDQPLLRNFMFEYERKVTTSTFYQTEIRKDINSARFFYRFSF